MSNIEIDVKINFCEDIKPRIRDMYNQGLTLQDIINILDIKILF